MKVYVPAGSIISIQTVLGDAQSISAISKTDPAVVSYAGADPANDSYAALELAGMLELNESIVKVANVNAAANTFEAVDQDATEFGAFVSGSLRPITFGATLEAATGFSFSGGEAKTQTYTLLKDEQEMETIVGYGKVAASIPCLWDPQDEGLKLVRRMAKSKKKLGFKIAFPNGLEILFFGQIGASGLPSVQNAQSIMETTISLSLQSLPTYVYPA